MSYELFSYPKVLKIPASNHTKTVQVSQGTSQEATKEGSTSSQWRRDQVMTYIASVIHNPYLQKSMHLDLHRLIKTLSASSYPALVWKTFPHNAYDNSSSSRLTLSICQYLVPSVTSELSGRTMLYDPMSWIWRENFFSWTADYFHRSYLRTALTYF